MARIFPDYKRSTIYAVVGGVVHFSLLSLTYTLEFIGQGGENFLSWLVSFWNWPLLLIVFNIDLFKIFNDYFILYVGGTLLAAIEGWIVGAVIDAFLDWRLKNWGF